MMSFKVLFNDWIRNITNSQLETIDEICELLGISANLWFANYFERNDFTKQDFIHELRSSFIFYVAGEFEKCLLKYIEPSGKNIYREPYISMDFELDYIKNKGFIIMNRKGFNKISKKLTISQKEDLMKIKLFSTIVIQTKLKIYSKKDIRFLKIKSLNEYSESIEK